MNSEEQIQLIGFIQDTFNKIIKYQELSMEESTTEEAVHTKMSLKSRFSDKYSDVFSDDYTMGISIEYSHFNFSALKFIELKEGRKFTEVIFEVVSGELVGDFVKIKDIKSKESLVIESIKSKSSDDKNYSDLDF
jgi:hypothetical protein